MPSWLWLPLAELVVGFPSVWYNPISISVACSGRESKHHSNKYDDFEDDDDDFAPASASTASNEV